MKASSCVHSAVAFAVVALGSSSSAVKAQDVIVDRHSENEGAMFTSKVEFAAGTQCTGDYTFTSVPAPVIQSKPKGQCVTDSAGVSQTATCSGTTLSTHTIFSEPECGGTGTVQTDSATCVSDPSYASKSVCFASKAGGLLAKGRLFTTLDACENGDYFDDSVQYWSQYVPPEQANKCMASAVDGHYVQHSCGTSGDKFSTYYSDSACTNVTQPTQMVPGAVSTFGVCSDLETDNYAIVLEECVTFVKEGAGGRAELTGGLAVFSMIAALSLLLNCI